MAPGTTPVPDGVAIRKGQGVLVVDFEGLESTPEFTIGGIGGEPDHLGAVHRPGSSMATRSLKPGVYSVFWFLPDRVGWYGARVRVEAGRVTRLHAEGPESGRWPLHEDFGRVELTLHAVGGGYLPWFEFSVEPDYITVEMPPHFKTNRNGQQSFDVRAGRHCIHAGASRTWVDVKAGETIGISIHPDGLGDLFFDLPPGSPRIVVRRTKDEQWSPGPADWWSDGRRQGYRCIPPGVYEVAGIVRPGRKPCGEATVRAGEPTEFRGAYGAIQVRIHRPDEGHYPHSRGLQVERLVESRWEYWWFLERSDAVRLAPGVWSMSAPYLEPGRYRVRLGPRGYPVEVVVDDELVVVELTLDR